MTGLGDQTENRDIFMKFRVNATEKAVIEAGAKRLELAASELIRQAVFEKLERDLKPHDDRPPSLPAAPEL